MLGNSFTSNFKLIIKFSVFIIIVITGLNITGKAYTQAAKKNTVNAFTKQRFDEFYALEKNSLDMAFVGSSHSYCTFDPEIFDSELGTNSWQFGSPAQHPDTTYYVLKEVFNYQSPKIVVMEIYWDMCDDSFEPKQADSFFEVLKNQELKEEYIKNVFPLGEKAKYNIPAIRYQQDYFNMKNSQWEKLLEEKYSVSKPWKAPANGVEYYQSKGYVYCDIILDEDEYDKTNQFKNFDAKNWDFASEQKKYIEKIIELCNEKDAQLIFVTAPVANVSMDFIKNYHVINNKVSSFAKENGIAYIDYNIVNKEENMLQNENFRDDAHLNHSGVEIVDKHFLKWLKENIKS